MSETEASFSKARLEAFSDGVIAVIITIMVLELKAPESAQWADLLKLWPAFLGYLVSFVFLAIYWINHHNVLTRARRVTPGMIWANNILLFCLSLFPFATAYMAATHLAALPTVLYASLQFVCGLAFNLLLRTIIAQCEPGEAAIAALSADSRKAKLAHVIYAAAIALAYVSPLAALALFIAVAAGYVVPGVFARSITAPPP